MFGNKSQKERDRIQTGVEVARLHNAVVSLREEVESLRIRVEVKSKSLTSLYRQNPKNRGIKFEGIDPGVKVVKK